MTVEKLTVLLIMTHSLTWAAAIPAYAQDDDKPSNKHAMPPALTEHPVLHVKPFEPALGKPDSSVFKKLNGMLKTPSMSKAVGSSYENAEFTVVQEFCNQAQGQTPLAVEKLANEPFLKGGESPCQPSIVDGNEHWLYIFGTTPIFARLVFKHGICNESWANVYHKDPWYVSWYMDWRGSQLKQFVVGKTIAEIVDREGTPSDSIPNVATTWCTPEGLTDFWRNLKIKQGTLVYQTGSISFSNLTFKDSICVEVSDSIRSGRQKNCLIPFRMPPRE
jgi:hypothetical protein